MLINHLADYVDALLHPAVREWPSKYPPAEDRRKTVGSR